MGMQSHINPQQVQDVAGTRQAIVHLLYLVEELKQEILSQHAEIQALRDEINRLKGEDGKPDIKANKKQKKDHSSVGFSLAVKMK
jgi:regulator of replication initiation timing